MNKEDVILTLEAPGYALENMERAVERYERAFTRVVGGAIRYDKDKVDGGGGDPDMPLINVAQRSIELDEARASYSAAVDAAQRLIGLLPDGREQTVLTSRYVETPALTWPQLAEALGLSVRQTYRLKNNAIASLCDMACGEVLAAVS